jgi:arabinose-5-phosphate isomerase
VREVLVHVRKQVGNTARRTGAIMVVDPDGILRGIFTDSDLAKLFESRRDSMLDDPIRHVMTKGPARAPQGSMMVDAVAIMAERKISELPVIDAAGRPVGMIDITDVVGLFPEIHPAVNAPAATARVGGPPKPKSPLFSQPNLPRESA